MSESELERWFPRPPAATTSPLGVVVSGSLSRGLDAKLAPDRLIEGLAVGRYVVIRGQTERRFFGMITDVALETQHPEVEQFPPADPDGFLARAYRGTLTSGRVHITPMLVLEKGEVRPAKTVPAHFTQVYDASPEEVAEIFGNADEAGHFYIGEPLEMPDTRVALDLKRFVERSSGIFGKSGTGKTFLTRMVLAGIIQERAAVNLIFDMHNEYGWKSQDESRQDVKGLRQLFYDGRVSVFTLDPESSRRRGSKVDFTVRIGYEQLEPEDLEMLAPLFGFTEVQTNALYMLRRRLGPAWVHRLLSDEPDEGLAALTEDGKQIHEGTLGAIQRKLAQLYRFGFLVDEAPDDPIGRILDYINSGKSVVLEFGRYGNALEAYILVANYITRRIHQAYVTRKEASLGGQGQEPRPLVITIEEAHKFLDPAIAKHTIFGTIAREMRKYNVTLLVVDQRPSGIDPEVMSQIGTRITALLDEENDIRAVFTGVAGSAALREVLARLETRQQALILGHAVPMPVVIRTRDYDDLYGEIQGHAADSADIASALYP